MKAIWNGVVVAESDDTVVVEGNHYFPLASVREEVLSDSSRQTTCAWKGRASYFNIEADGKVNENAAWFYADPKPAASQVADRVAFWKGVQVTP